MLIKPGEYFSSFKRAPNKSKGQHFLVQPNTAKKIVEALDIQPGDEVIEIGPGLGALTGFLIEKLCNLHLVEIDEFIAKALKKALEENQSIKAKITWHIEDILKVDLHKLKTTSKKVKVIGNIPYNISSPILFKLIESNTIIDKAVLMVQKEVGMRWTADPRSKDYGIPTVILRCSSKSVKLFEVKAGQFYPPPKVDSLVVGITFMEKPLWEPLPYRIFHNLLKTLFQNRRKTILNGLKKIVSSKELIQECLELHHLSPFLRPEEIQPEVFVSMAKFLFLKQRTLS